MALFFQAKNPPTQSPGPVFLVLNACPASPPPLGSTQTMNRIYQGRANALQILTPVPLDRLDSKALAGFDSPLWRHHALFQDAVNYYHLCLVALAGPDANRPLAKLKEQMQAAWDDEWDTRPDSWRVLLAARLGISASSRFDDAMTKVLEGNGSAERARELAGELLLNKIEGDIQQSGRGYWPRFCDPKANPTYDYSATARASASGLARLAGVIHADGVSAEALARIAAEMDLSWTVKVQPAEFFEAADARARLLDGVKHFLKSATADSPSPKLAEVLERFPAGVSEWEALPEKIAALPDDVRVPRNRKASPDLTFATLLFKHFPTPFTAAVLGLSVAKPRPAKAAKPVEKVSARRKAGAVTQAVVVEDQQIDFAELGDDPIKLARGERGFVFPAFTSLTGWAIAAPHAPVWKEFDIAAFKEALKTVNQFGLKTGERNALLAEARRRLEYMNEETTVWKSSDSEEPGQIPPRLKTDPNFALVQDLLDNNGISNRATGEEHVPRGVYAAGLRGFYAIKKDWTELWERRLEKNAPPPTEQELLEIVTDYQRDHLNDVGDVQLFRALCQEKYWPLWRPLTEDEKAERNGQGRARDMIAAYREYLEVRDDADHLAKPIRFTPAHAERSRRLFMFSDISGSHGVKFGDDGHSVTVSIVSEVEGRLMPVRAQIDFTAPRVARDELGNLSGGSETVRWLQPMMKALGCPEPAMPALEKCAVSLMPDVQTKGDGRWVRLLLNFPATLEPAGLIGHLGKQALWFKQFNGTYKPRTMQVDTGLSLYWPGMDKAPEADAEGAWWNRPAVHQHGITTLSVDLGQRDAGAWALLETRCDEAFSRGKKSFLQLGEAGGKPWGTALLGQGMMRLPGEDAKTGALDDQGRRTVEFHGKAGRNAVEVEWNEALEIAALFGGEEAKSRLGVTHTQLSHPAQNAELLRLISRGQSRLSRFHRWSCRIHKKPKAAADDILDYGEVDAELTRLTTLMKEKLDHLKPEPDAAPEVMKAEADAVYARLEALIPELKKTVRDSLLRLANRELPLRGRDWVWNDAKGQLEEGNFSDDTLGRWIRGQRGLSMDRIEQIEMLRKRFMALKRQMALAPGVEVSQGVEDKGRRIDEPCQKILDKLDRLKQQRVNQTAHLILVQALGLRLRPHQESAQDRHEKDIHGEYEPMPGRKPVDFIVMEDLSRYLSSQGRAPSENRRLMKWCHRAVLGKLKQMCEPFGIAVLEVPAAYSSRFCALTGVPGFRAMEVHDGNADDFRWKRLIKKAEKDKSSKDAVAAATHFDQLRRLNAELREKKILDKGTPLRTLLVPVAGGPIFVPIQGGGPRQADMNAAINLGLRALASPTCLQARPKVRAELKDGTHHAIHGNKLEKAAGLELQPPPQPSKELATQKRTNFFFDEDGVGGFDTGWVIAGGKRIRVSGSMALWKAVKDRAWQRVAELNQKRIAKWLGLAPDSDDEIPM